MNINLNKDLDPKMKLNTRLVTKQDEELLLIWANDPVVRSNGFNTKKISKKMHRKWFNSRISDTENCKFYIVETEWGLPIGQVRLDKKDEKWYINFSLAEFARGKKMGSILLQKIFNNFDPFQKTEFIA